MAGKNQIGYSDLFNDSGRDILLQAIRDIKELKATYKEFAADVTGAQVANNNNGMAALAKEIKAVAQASRELNITNEAGQKALADNLRLVEQLRAENEMLRKSKEGARNEEKHLAGSINGLNEQLKEQIKLYRALDQSTEKGKLSGERLAAQIRVTKTEIRTLNDSMKETTKVFNYAKGSYAELNAQTKQYEAQLKRLGGAFDGTNPKVQELQKKIFENTAQLKKFDEQMNQNFRNVGNYRSAFNGLGNSINQLSREMPAFANSVQTGFMALSNNIPILADEITRLKERNVALRAEGQPTQSVFKQIAGALFSWQTALSIGVTLLTIFGKEIVNWVSGLFKSADAMKELKERQSLVNDVMKQANQDAAKQIVSLKLLYNTATDVNATLEERRKAVEALKKQFPDYFGDLNSEIIMNGKAKKSYEDLTKEIIKSSRAKAAKDKIDALQAGLLDLEFTESKVKGTTAKELAAPKINKVELVQGEAKTTKTVEEQNREIEKRRDAKLKEISLDKQRLQQQQDYLIKFVGGENVITQTVVEGSKVRTKSAEELQREMEEAIRKQDELLKAAQKWEIAQAELSFANSKKTFDDEVALENKRLEINKRYGKRRMDIWRGYEKEVKNIETEVTEAIKDNAEKIDAIEAKRRAERDRDIQESAKAEIAKAQLILESSSKQFSDEVIFEQRKIEVLRAAFEQRLALYERDSDEYRNILTEKENAEAASVARMNAIREGRRRAKEGSDDAGNDLTRTIISSNIRKDAAKGKISQEEAERQLHLNRLAQMRDEVSAKEAQLAKQKDGDADYYNTLKELSNLRKGIIEEETAFAIKKAEEEKEAKIQMQQAAFDFAVTTMGQAFDLGRELNQARISDLEKQQEQEVLLAGNNAAARAAIEERFHKKIADLKRKQAIFDKLQALVTIAINTAMGVTNALAKTATIPLVPFIIASGAVQAAAVLAKPIPKYAKGRQGGPAELAEVNEQGFELIEKNGRMRVANEGKRGFTFLQPGETVHTAEATRRIVENAILNEDVERFVSSLLSGTGVVKSYESAKEEKLIRAITSNGINESILVSAFGRAINAIPVSTIEANEHGIRKFVKTMQGKVEHLNGRNKLGGNG